MPALQESKRAVLIRVVSRDAYEAEIASWIDYYRSLYGDVHHVWCNRKDRSEAWTVTTTDGLQWQVEPKGGVPQGHVFVH